MLGSRADVVVTPALGNSLLAEEDEGVLRTSNPAQDVREVFGGDQLFCSFRKGSDYFQGQHGRKP